MATNDNIRKGSAPNFCPPTEEGITLSFEDEKGDVLDLEFLGMIILNDHTYGFFFPVDDENPALSSGEIVILEVTEVDDDGEPVSFELLEDEDLALTVYGAFQKATKDLYRFQ